MKEAKADPEAVYPGHLDDSACLVNHNFPICRNLPLLPSFPTMFPQSPRPRAADDFAVIRARMEELRHERAQVLAKRQLLPATGPRSCAVGSRPAPANRRNLQDVIRRLMIEGRKVSLSGIRGDRDS